MVPGGPDRAGEASVAERRRERESLARVRAVTDGRLIERAAGILAAAERDWQRAPEVIARGLREAHKLPSVERRLLAEMLHGWVRQKRRLMFLAGTRELRRTLLVWLLLEARAGSEAGAPEVPLRSGASRSDDGARDEGALDEDLRAALLHAGVDPADVQAQDE